MTKAPCEQAPSRPSSLALLDRHRGRELDTIEAMFRVYCRDKHGKEPFLCDECGPLLDYATRRLTRCVFGEDKPTCANCTVHCYSDKMRAPIKEIMRYAGPRMMWRHPWLAIHHVIAERRPAPSLSRNVVDASADKPR